MTLLLTASLPFELLVLYKSLSGISLYNKEISPQSEIRVTNIFNGLFVIWALLMD